MTALRRAFLAVVPPAAVLDAVDALLERPETSRFSWTRRDQWHLTLQFFGRVADADSLVAALAPAVAGVPTATVRLRGAGAFPQPKKAEVFWLGVEGVEGLAVLHEAVMGAAGAWVARRDRARFHCHLTLARLKRVTDLRPDVEALDAVAIGPAWTVREVLLLESDTRPDGAVYTEQARLALRGSS